LGNQINNPTYQEECPHDKKYPSPQPPPYYRPAIRAYLSGRAYYVPAFATFDQQHSIRIGWSVIGAFSPVKEPDSVEGKKELPLAISIHLAV